MYVIYNYNTVRKKEEQEEEIIFRKGSRTHTNRLCLGVQDKMKFSLTLSYDAFVDE